MTRDEPTLEHALRQERRLSSDQVWDAAELRLDRPISQGVNTAHECSDRWARDPSRVAIIVCDPDGTHRRWTFAELTQASSRLATAWRAAGVRRGDRVAAVVTQQVETYICALAAWRSGLIYVPLFVGFGASAVSERVASCEPAVVVVDSRYRSMLTDALSLAGVDPKIYTIGPAAVLEHGDRSLWDEIERNIANSPALSTAASDPATLMYTSGTTGKPKGCIQPHSLILTLQPFARHVFALTANDLLFAAANPGWAYGLYVTGASPMSLGLPRVVYTGDFDPEQWLRVIADQSVTFLSAAPSAYRRLVEAVRENGLPSTVRGATSAGEPLDTPLAEAWHALTGFDIQDGYGQSEAAMMLATLACDETPLQYGSLSSSVPGFDVELVDADGVVQPEEGIIALWRPRYQASLGYWNADDLWAARWRGEYFLTGDVARRDSEGRYRFVGRDDDVIVTSGYKVGPSEVETVMLSHPQVRDAVAVAAPDARRGSVVRAVLVLAEGAKPEQVGEEIRAMVRSQVGRHAYPRVIDFIDELPRNQAGKVLRHLIRRGN